MRRKFFDLVKENMGGDNDICEYKNAKECPACDDCDCCEQCLAPDCILTSMFWTYKEIGRSKEWLEEFATQVVVPYLRWMYVESTTHSIEEIQEFEKELQENYADIIAYTK